MHELADLCVLSSQAEPAHHFCTCKAKVASASPGGPSAAILGQIGVVLIVV